MTTDNAPNNRLKYIGFIFLLLAGVIFVRLAQVQLVQHGHFSVLASQSHNRKFEIAAQRGNIYAYDRGEPIPIAMNRSQKTLYVDTRYIFNQSRVVDELESILGKDYTEEISGEDGYVLLEEEIPFFDAQTISELDISGIGISDSYNRVYPEGELAAQVLGFVNSDGDGQYGVEGHLDEYLRGTPGMFDIETDAGGIPIATGDNIQTQPIEGNDVVLTIDRNIQARVESVLEQGVADMGAKSAHAIVMEIDSGRVLSMANYPTFDPNEYSQVEDYRRFINVTTSELFEPGSGFKVFTMAAGLESGAINADDQFFDEGSVTVDDAVISNVQSERNITRDVAEVIINSINTGALYILEQMGGGEINTLARTGLYDFFTDRFALTSPTGIEQPGEPSFGMNDPQESSAVNYVNMTFGQGIATSMMRMTASMAGIINDGTMYEPRLVDYQMRPDGSIVDNTPVIAAENVVSTETSESIRQMMADSVRGGGGYAVSQRLPDHAIGGKTGTAEIPDEEGGYKSDDYIGSFIGFAPVDEPKYIVMVRVDEPQTIFGYAGSAAAGPIFGDIMEWLVKYEGIAPSD